MSTTGCSGWFASDRALDSTPGRTPESCSDARPVCTGPLRIGTSGDYDPFSRTVQAGRGSAPDARRFHGFSIDVARAFAAETGRSVVWQAFRWTRLEAQLRAHDFDLALSGITVRPDRSVVGRFGLPLTESGLVVLVPEAAMEAEASAAPESRAADAPAVPATAAELDRPGIVLAVNAGGHLERTARRLFPRARIVAVPKNGDVLGRLADPGIDAVVTDSLEAPHWQRRRPGLRAIGPLTRDRKAAWFPRADPALRRAFDRWVLAAERDGRLARLRRTHGLPPTRTARPIAALLASFDERLSLMPAVAAAKRVLGRPVEDRPREARVLAAAAAAIARESERQGVPAPEEAAVRALYRAQIEAAKAIQSDWLRASERGAPSGPHAPEDPRVSAAAAGPHPAETSSDAERARAQHELDEALRPALLDLGDRVAWLLVVARAERAAAPARDVVAQALARHALEPAAVAAIHEGLRAVLEEEAPTR